MQIFVIHLENDHARRDWISQQFDKLGIPFEFFKACDGRALTPGDLAASYDAKWAKRRIGRPMSPAEIGCALSHIGVYQEIVRRQLPYALVLEDDATLPDDLVEVMEAIPPHISNDKPEVILCGYRYDGRVSGPVQLTAKRQLHAYSPRQGACAYFINYIAARALSSALLPIQNLADGWKRQHFHRMVDFKLIQPTLITQNVVDLPSTIWLAYWNPDGNLGNSRIRVRRALPWLAHKLNRAFWKAVDLPGAGYDRIIRRYGGLQ